LDFYSQHFGTTIPLLFDFLLYLLVATGLVGRAPSGRPHLEPATLVAPGAIGVASIGRDPALAKYWATSRARLSNDERSELEHLLATGELQYGDTYYDLLGDRARMERLGRFLERLHVVYTDFDASEEVMRYAVVLEMVDEASAIAMLGDPTYVLPTDEVERVTGEDGREHVQFDLNHTWCLVRRGHVLVCAQDAAQAHALGDRIADPLAESLATSARYRAAAPRLAREGAGSLYFDLPNYFASMRKALPRPSRSYLDQQDALFGWYDLGAITARIYAGERGPALELDLPVDPDGEPVAMWIPAGSKADPSLARLLGPDTCLAVQLQPARAASAMMLGDFLAGCDRALGAGHRGFFDEHEAYYGWKLAELANEATGPVLLAWGAHDPIRAELGVTLDRLAGRAPKEDAWFGVPMLVAFPMRAGAAERLAKVAASVASHRGAGNKVTRHTHAGVEWLAFGTSPRAAGAVIGGTLVFTTADAMCALIDRALAPAGDVPAALVAEADHPRTLRMAYGAAGMMRTFRLVDWQRWGYFDLDAAGGGGAIKRGELVIPDAPAPGPLYGSLAVERRPDGVSVSAVHEGSDGARRLLDALRVVEDARRLNSLGLLYSLYYDGQRFQAVKGAWPESLKALDKWGEDQDYNGYPAGCFLIHGKPDPAVAEDRRVLAYTRGATLHGGRSVLTADGKIRFVPTAAFAELARANALGDDPPVEPPEDE